MNNKEIFQPSLGGSFSNLRHAVEIETREKDATTMQR